MKSSWFKLYEADDLVLMKAVFEFLRPGIKISSTAGEGIRLTSSKSKVWYEIYIKASYKEQIVRAMLSANAFAAGWLENEMRNKKKLHNSNKKHN